MAWYNGGNWEGLHVSPDWKHILHQLCAAVNEREQAIGTTYITGVSSLTRSSTVATMTFGSAHGLSVGDYVRVFGVASGGFNGFYTITGVPTSTQVQFTCSGFETTPALNPERIRVSRGSSPFQYNEAGNTKFRPAASDFVGIHKSRGTGSTFDVGKLIGQIQSAITSLSTKFCQGDGAYKSATITRSGTTATVDCTAHGYQNNDIVFVFGADQWQYNGRYTITVVDVDTFTFVVNGSPTSPATGTILVSKRTPFTGITQLLTAGTYGTSWLDPATADKLDLFYQMKEALENLHTLVWTGQLDGFSTLQIWSIRSSFPNPFASSTAAWNNAKAATPRTIPPDISSHATEVYWSVAGASPTSWQASIRHVTGPADSVWPQSRACGSNIKRLTEFTAMARDMAMDVDFSSGAFAFTIESTWPSLGAQFWYDAEAFADIDEDVPWEVITIDTAEGGLPVSGVTPGGGISVVQDQMYVLSNLTTSDVFTYG